MIIENLSEERPCLYLPDNQIHKIVIRKSLRNIYYLEICDSTGGKYISDYGDYESIRLKFLQATQSMSNVSI